MLDSSSHIRPDRLRLQQMHIDCIVGVYPSERDRPEPLQLDLTLFLDTRGAAHGGGLGMTVDYARLFGELRFLLLTCRFLLLEEAAAAICRYVLAEPTTAAPKARPYGVQLKLTKTNALQGQAVPSLEVFRERDEIPFDRREVPYGLLDIIYETRSCGIYRRRLAPGATQPAHMHTRLEEHELALTDGLLVQGKPASAGSARSWPREFVHENVNPSPVEQSILCVHRPLLSDSDETVVPPPAAGLQDLPVELFYRDETSAS